MAQWTYDAYGAVLTAEHLHSHPPLHAGHKGLLVDRLDAPITDSSADDGETPRLVPLARVICQNRNRTYAPALGRFLQADPNATGAVVISNAALMGTPLHPEVTALGVESRYADGMDLYQYLGSNPTSRDDPMGLSWDDYWDSFREGWGVATNAYVTATALTDVHGLIQESVRALTEDYSLNLEMYMDWAMDWSRGDDEHSRGDDRWVTAALLRGGIEHFNLSYWEHFADQVPGDQSAIASAGAMAGKIGRGAGKVSRFIRKAPFKIGDFRKAQQRVLTMLGVPQGLPRDAGRALDGGQKWGDNTVGYRLNKPDTSGKTYWHIDFFDRRSGKKRGRGTIEGWINLETGTVAYKDGCEP